MRVRLLQRWLGQPEAAIGDVVEMDRDLAESWFKQGICEPETALRLAELGTGAAGDEGDEDSDLDGDEQADKHPDTTQLDGLTAADAIPLVKASADREQLARWHTAESAAKNRTTVLGAIDARLAELGTGAAGDEGDETATPH